MGHGSALYSKTKYDNIRYSYTNLRTFSCSETILKYPSRPGTQCFSFIILLFIVWSSNNWDSIGEFPP